MALQMHHQAVSTDPPPPPPLPFVGLSMPPMGQRNMLQSFCEIGAIATDSMFASAVTYGSQCSLSSEHAAVGLLSTIWLTVNHPVGQ